MFSQKIRKTFYKQFIMEQKDNSSQQNYSFLILKAFSRLASGKCISVRRVHCLPSESRQINKNGRQTETLSQFSQKIGKRVYKQPIMEQKDNSSQQNYSFLILKAFSLLASGKCISVRIVHRLPSGKRIASGKCWQEIALWQENAYSSLQ